MLERYVILYQALPNTTAAPSLDGHHPPHHHHERGSRAHTHASLRSGCLTLKDEKALGFPEG